MKRRAVILARLMRRRTALENRKRRSHGYRSSRGPGSVEIVDELDARQGTRWKPELGLLAGVLATVLGSRIRRPVKV